MVCVFSYYSLEGCLLWLGLEMTFMGLRVEGLVPSEAVFGGGSL